MNIVWLLAGILILSLGLVQVCLYHYWDQHRATGSYSRVCLFLKSAIYYGRRQQVLCPELSVNTRFNADLWWKDAVCCKIRARAKVTQVAKLRACLKFLYLMICPLQVAIRGASDSDI